MSVNLNPLIAGSPTGTVFATGHQEFQASAGGTPAYIWPGTQSASTADVNRQVLIPRAATLRGFQIKTTSAQPSNGALTFTLRINGVDTTCTLVVAASGAAGVYSATWSYAVPAGSLVSISMVNASADTVSAKLGQSVIILD